MKIGVFYLLFFIICSGCMNINNKTETEKYRQTSSGEKKEFEENPIDEEIDENSVAADSSDTFLEASVNRVYFTAAGNEPFWGLEITEKDINFTFLDSITNQFSAPFRYPIRADDTTIKTYKLKTEQMEMLISISEEECINTMSGAISAYKVEVNLKRNTDKDFLSFLGCGSYTIDSNLQGYWALEKIGENKLEDSLFEINFPHIEIQTQANTFFGFAGCNKIHGSLFSEWELLRFTNLKSPKKICNQANIEDQFLEALQQVTSYTVSNATLKLKNPSRVLMQFNKVEN
ncbi:MAG: hypothetical protein AUK33_09145 [Flavobacteriaceae bacterium CG2_30_34_30]|nr:MAG: hypothetical protein AUK33_09145 [Flavobacteriaceae bacterium CG2_30_34_30]